MYAKSFMPKYSVYTHTNIPSIHTNTRIINFGYMLISINDSVKDKQFIAFIIF